MNRGNDWVELRSQSKESLISLVRLDNTIGLHHCTMLRVQVYTQQTGSSRPQGRAVDRRTPEHSGIRVPTPDLDFVLGLRAKFGVCLTECNEGTALY